ncbi:hypothetical protein K2F40_14760 [Clostridium sp. CM028]|uniref:hypothetical protein n=1 Tax=unclassified Clostridium TaxID=2614128 RepID=UPI001C6DDDFD|nr:MULTISPECIES: hypothetical protein [unclassified Clostridium]MBW9146845.1 hypothetical protein [Clostridium sp. CM027]MBW9150219.1 hypothetical protein [Clostridium sp. CM028]UVE42826.1 hypothetical protein KTC92_18050 [Clostridium sp. CM027]WLC63485.1 hypothetical protein KTC94_17315 [Clostridium sp. CM028]
MNNIALVLYVIRLRGIDDNKYVNLDNVNGKPFINVFNDYCLSRKNISCNEELGKAINIKNLTIDDDIFHGQLETGNYGYSSEIKSISTSKTTHKKTIEEADMMPLFFYACIPKDAYKGLFALEKFRTFGCKTIFENDLNQFFEDNKYKIKGTLHPILPENVAKQYLTSGGICRMRLVKHTVPKDIADVYKEEYRNGEFGTFEYVINPKKNKFLSFKKPISKFLNNTIGLKNIIEIDGIEYDNIKVELLIGKKKRTISLNNLNNLTGDIDISDDVEFEIDGHPKYESILEIAQDIVEEYVEIIDYKNYRLKENAGVNRKEEINETPITIH